MQRRYLIAILSGQTIVLKEASAMDLSKLPRMSQTPAPAPPAPAPPADSTTPLPPGSDGMSIPTPAPAAATPAGAASQPGGHYVPQYYLDPSPSAGAEAWISIVIGLILLLASPYTLQWLISLISSYKPPFLPITSTDLNTGQVTELPYPQSIFFFGHVCVFAFALVMIISGLILFTRRTALVAAAFVFTAIATLMNLIYVIKATFGGEALPIISAFAVAFGGYIAFSHWRMLQLLRLAGSYDHNRPR
jgi:hypothetical protein